MIGRIYKFIYIYSSTHTDPHRHAQMKYNQYIHVAMQTFLRKLAANLRGTGWLGLGGLDTRCILLLGSRHGYIGLSDVHAICCHVLHWRGIPCHILALSSQVLAVAADILHGLNDGRQSTCVWIVVRGADIGRLWGCIIRLIRPKSLIGSSIAHVRLGVGICIWVIREWRVGATGHIHGGRAPGPPTT